ncbi:hypothetical protein WA026_009312 [Henosepilachna vigintioctopunctata]|uniref:Uncharacterized protein n=1 Tax=Henosepilachna vigintioctopunctata TaxID=420089 RepID=A0AAW1UVC9_9CUCU
MLGGCTVHLAQFALTVASTDFELLFLTGTWLSPDFHNAELVLKNYYIYRRNRDSNTSLKKLGGGVLIAIKNNLDSHLISTDFKMEAIFVFARIFSKNNM